ncbi:4'-phosphopantetheinyl transferase family protein [Candidatus Entotheonella palauensis]|uniref:4'-phosphopantetheinyl transferase family protein n=1 Tax=Candidatus Entotheonella palauensis TaxID=93172 RepID=UPI0015C4BAED|nr:4'-phosphopantetheinyl transferase superfamily protein [Candidatus Entotheonella palauensis]
MTLWARPIEPSLALHLPPGPVPQWLSAPEQAEWATFATRKRAEEFRAGRHLLRTALTAQGFQTEALSITRDSHRAPVLRGLPQPPSFSICHCGHLAERAWSLVLIGPPGWQIGLDAEPLTPPLPTSVLGIMARGAEREALAAADAFTRLRAWVLKECVQKALKLGMHLDPRTIDTRVTPIRLLGYTVDVRVFERWGLMIGTGVARPDTSASCLQ